MFLFFFSFFPSSCWLFLFSQQIHGILSCWQTWGQVIPHFSCVPTVPFFCSRMHTSLFFSSFSFSFCWLPHPPVHLFATCCISPCATSHHALHIATCCSLPCATLCHTSPLSHTAHCHVSPLITSRLCHASPLCHTSPLSHHVAPSPHVAPLSHLATLQCSCSGNGGERE